MVPRHADPVHEVCEYVVVVVVQSYQLTSNKEELYTSETVILHLYTLVLIYYFTLKKKKKKIMQIFVSHASITVNKSRALLRKDKIDQSYTLLTAFNVNIGFVYLLFSITWIL